ncbi:MAG: LytR/AlgR family response regulator transcription factor [Cyclobacteriaceae bacterium]|jgi:two-component system response regulator LytT
MERVVIVEDEKLAADKLVRLLQLHAPTFSVEAILESVESAVTWLSGHDVDLIFLDIQLKDGESFAIFERVTVKAPVIFITAFDHYAIKAFKHNGIDYILKPIDEEELVVSINRYLRARKDKRSDRLILDKLQQLVSDVRPGKRRILVAYGQKIRSIEIDEVAYFYVIDRGVFLATFSSEVFLTDETLDVLEKDLDSGRFFRLNRKIISNIKSIKEVTKYSTRQLKVALQPSPEFEVIISAEKVTPFKNWLNT